MLINFPFKNSFTVLVIQEIIVNEDLLEESFACNLDACKGACCWEGDWGAPLETEELHILEKEYPAIASFLDDLGRETIEQEGPFTLYSMVKSYGTPLKPDASCAYLVYDEQGIGQCGIELAWKAGATDFPKPVSCHLYPVRAQTDQHTGMETLRYDRWDICRAACEKGRKENIPVYRFVKSALIRKYGEAWYEELEAAAAHLSPDRQEK